jgi:hypothetical protein
MQVQDHRKAKATLFDPNIDDVTSSFLVRRVGNEVTIQQVRHNVELVIAVCRGLVFTGSDDGYSILTHQSADPRCPTSKPISFSSSVIHGLQ